MAFIYFNPNPSKKLVGDCVIRAISKLTGQDWRDVHTDLCRESFEPEENELQSPIYRAFSFLWGKFGVKFIKLPMLAAAFSFASSMDMAC